MTTDVEYAVYPDIIKGTAYVVFREEPRAITERQRLYFPENQVREYRDKGYTVLYEQPEFRKPYIVISKFIDHDWENHLSEMEHCKKEIDSLKKHNFLVTNEKEFMKAYNKAYTDCGSREKEKIVKKQKDRLICLLSFQSFETLERLIDTASWHLIEHYETEQITVPPEDQLVIDLKTKWGIMKKK